jgi:kanamycin kinase/aminoglycoside 3'-phosphotransferase-2
LPCDCDPVAAAPHQRGEGLESVPSHAGFVCVWWPPRRDGENDLVIDGLRRRFADYQWQVVAGHSGAVSYRLVGHETLFIKVVHTGAATAVDVDLVAEAERAAWLRDQGIAVPEVVEVDNDAEGRWLITRSLGGRCAAEVWPGDDRWRRAVDGVAELVTLLHALPARACPFDRSLAATMPLARRAVAAGLVDLEDVDEQYDGWDAARLLATLEASAPEHERDVVVCHGDLTLSNILLDPDSLVPVGLVDLGRVGRAERDLDLALMTRDLAERDAPSGRQVQRFLSRCGGPCPVDDERLAFYRLLDEFF